MALRQMSLARMGQYRAPVQPVSEGGKVGRPKLLHNGTGHGLTGGGGLNAKGTGGGIKVSAAMRPMHRQLRKAKYAANKTQAIKQADRVRNDEKKQKDPTQGGRPMAPHPVGRFQYGANQWGFINAKGQVNWKSTAPKAGQPVVGWNQVTPYLKQTGALTKMPQRNTNEAYYKDSIYARNMADRQQNLSQAQAAYEYAKNAQAQDYRNQLTDLGIGYQDNVSEANIGLGGANLAGSGIAAAALAKLAQQFQEGNTRTAADNTLKNTQITADLTNAQTGFNTGQATELGVAKDRWLATNPTAKDPMAGRGFSKDKIAGNIYTGPTGIPQTWGGPIPKAKVKPKVKAKNPVGKAKVK